MNIGIGEALYHGYYDDDGRFYKDDEIKPIQAEQFEQLARLHGLILQDEDILLVARNHPSLEKLLRLTEFRDLNIPKYLSQLPGTFINKTQRRSFIGVHRYVISVPTLNLQRIGFLEYKGKVQAKM